MRISVPAENEKKPTLWENEYEIETTSALLLQYASPRAIEASLPLFKASFEFTSPVETILLNALVSAQM
jgi:hypothetical protein